MTAANGNVLFNATTGSDTQSSGLGPSSAVYGNAASITSGSAVVTGISTTGVSSGDLLWVLSSSGRQFSVIASVDSSTQVTCDNNFDVTETGRTWACGGKRATLDDTSSRRLLGHMNVYELPSPSWAEIETDQTITSTVQGRGTRRIISSAGSKKQITFDLTSGTYCMTGGGVFKDIVFVPVSSSYIFGLASTSYLNSHNAPYFYNCVLKDFRALGVGYSRMLTCILRQSVVENVRNVSSSYGFGTNVIIGGNSPIRARNTIFKNCGHIPDHRSTAYECVFIGDGTHQVAGKMKLKRCAIYNYTNVMQSTSDLEINPAYQVTYDDPCIEECVIHTISSDVINLSSSTLTTHRMEARGNYFYNVNQFCNIAGVEDFISVNNTSLAADPFIDAANGDLNINDSANGGAVLRSTNYTLGG